MATPAEVKRLIQIIMQDHVGIQKPISKKGLLVLLRMAWPEEPYLERKMRKVIEEERLEINGRLEKACSVGKGYFIPANPDEARKAALFLTSYMTALSKRRKAIVDTYPSAGVGIQQEFPW